MKLLLIFCLISLSMSQDFSITGKVIDAKSGDPIEFVNVYKENSTFGNTTNSSGLFDIYGLESGTHIIIASYEGYITQKITVDMADNNKSKYIEFKLVEKIIEDSTVLVEALRIGKLKIRSNDEFKSFLKKPPKKLKYTRHNIPKETVIVFEIIEPIKEDTWLDWLSDNYTYIIIGATVIVISVAAL